MQSAAGPIRQRSSGNIQMFGGDCREGVTLVCYGVSPCDLQYAVCMCLCVSLCVWISHELFTAL